MATQTRFLEPFPAYSESSPLPLQDHSLLPFLMEDQSRIRSMRWYRWRNKLQLHYYQYEVTLGLYMLTPTEKWVTNAIFLTILIFLAWSLYTGLYAFVAHALERAIYYITGFVAEVVEMDDSRTPSTVANITARVMTSILPQ